MVAKFRVSKSVARKRQPQRAKRTTPIRRSERLQQRLAQEKKKQDTQIRPPTVAKPSRQKRKKPNKLHQRGQPAEKSQEPSSDPAERAHDDQSTHDYQSTHEDQSVDSFDAIDYWREHLDWPHWYLETEANMKVGEKRARPKTNKTTSNAGPSVVYDSPKYEVTLNKKKIFLDEDDVGLSDEVQQQLEDLFEREEPVPQNTLFDSDIFAKAKIMRRLRNEARIVRDITMLLVPSAEILTIRRPEEERIFLETNNELWANVIPITLPRPQPDFGVGFREEAFSKDQLERMQQFIGIDSSESYFKTSTFMLFPFLTCEVKCGKIGLDIADRQNAHSGAVGVRSVVELFRLVKREKELDHQVLAFAISHNNRSVRIFGYYPVIKGKSTKYYCYEIETFDFEKNKGRRKWDTYKFTRNIYDKWAPNHLERIRSAINQIPRNMVSDPSDSETPDSESQNSTNESNVPIPPRPIAKPRSRLSHVQNADEIEAEVQSEVQVEDEERDTDSEEGRLRRSKRKKMRKK